MTGLAAEILEALDGLHGVHPGFRTQHAQGLLLAGTFTAAPDASRLSRAAHFSGEPVRVTARFSNGSGDPTSGDNQRADGRGLAVKFYLPDGTTDLVGLSLPVFFVRTGRDFLEFVRARRPDPETGQMDFGKVGAFLGEHPETQAAVGQILPALCAPESYATCAYNSLHAFVLVGEGGTRTAGRYRWEPEAGEARLTDEDADAADHRYLHTEIVERAEREGVRFRLDFIVAEDEDDITDPTVAWPEDRERVALGHLELTGVDATREVDGDVLVFDPTRLTDGIELSGDEIPRIRSEVYELSVLRRTGVAR